MEYQHVIHPFEPIWNSNSEILILGSLPSVKSRENNFYYGHRQNGFWKVLSQVFEETEPLNIEEKKNMLLRNHIAIWDVIYSCDIKGSSDSSIKNVVPTDISTILNSSNVRKIYANGNKAGTLYKRYQQKITGKEIVILPSTSPANAAWSLSRLVEAWRVVQE